MSESVNENVEQAQETVEETQETVEVAEPVKNVAVITKSRFMNPDEYSEEELASLGQMYDNSFQDIKEGKIINGNVVGITEDNVVLDVGFKSDGSIPRNEFDPNEELKIGQSVDIVIESVEDEEGNLVLSKKRADFLKIWSRIMNAHDTEEILQGKILKRIKGGMVVDLLGLEAFLPGSQIDIRPVRDFDSFVGQTMDFKIVKVNVPTENVVISHKVLIEETIADQRKEILEGLEKGQILEGTVKAITDFGAFIDLGGVDGLIHITDLSWGRINHPNEVVKLDESIKVVVTDFDMERKRISLSLKQLLAHPWENIDEKYKISDKVAGRVVSLTDYGAFIEIEKGIEGLIHISEMSWTQHISHPSQFVSMGQVIEAVILSLDKGDKKISLGMKQLTPDPWEELMKKYPVGSKHAGTARNLTNFGVFVELEPGIDGLVHISDLSWTKKVRHPGEVVKKGEQIEVVVLAIDTDQRKISLGHKQIQDNPWDKFETEYSVGIETEGKIVRIIEKGLIVELPLGVDGFIPSTQLSTAKIKNLSFCFPIDVSLSLKVVEFDKENKKIVLSALAAFKDKTDEEINDYIKTHKLERVTVQDILSADLGKYDSSDFNLYDEKGNTHNSGSSNKRVDKVSKTVKKEPKPEKVKEEAKEEVAEPVADEVKEKAKEEVAEPAVDEVKEEAKEEVEEPVADEVKEEAKEEVAEPAVDEVKEEAKEEVAEPADDEVKEEAKEEVAEPAVDEVKEEAKDDVEEPVADEVKVEAKEDVDTIDEVVEAKEEEIKEEKVEESENKPEETGDSAETKEEK